MKLLYLSHLTPVALPYFSGVSYQCSFDPALYTANSAHQLGIVLPTSLQKAVVKRQAEYIAGRYLAKKCLNELGYNETHVGISKQRAPLWPKKVTGSISHSNNNAICIVQPLEMIEQGIGIDIERIMTDSTAASIKSTIINNEEYMLIINRYVNFAQGLTVVFSAKESLYKALYPQVRTYFDFLDAEVVALRSDCLTLVLRKDLTEKLTVGSAFMVHVQHGTTMVRTYVQS